MVQATAAYGPPKSYCPTCPSNDSVVILLCRPDTWYLDISNIPDESYFVAQCLANNGYHHRRHCPRVHRIYHARRVHGKATRSAISESQNAFDIPGYILHRFRLRQFEPGIRSHYRCQDYCSFLSARAIGLPATRSISLRTSYSFGGLDDDIFNKCFEVSSPFWAADVANMEDRVVERIGVGV